jgi:hypothetical protein
VDEIAAVRSLKTTVKPAVFNTFRRDRHATGVTDEQLAGSFESFAAALSIGLISASQSDLWRLYASTWARWVSAAPAATRSSLRGSGWSPDRQR